MRPRVRPLRPRPSRDGRTLLAKLIAVAGGVLAVALAVVIGYAVVPQGQGPAASAKTPTSTPVASSSHTITAVKKAVNGPLGYHEPLQAGKPSTAKAVSNFTYNTDPPTSGPFTSSWPTAFVASSPLAKGTLVHLESVGNIVVAYNGLSPATLKTITAFAQKEDAKAGTAAKAAAAGKGVFVTPWPGVAKGHAVLLAWTRRLDMTGWNASLAETFTQAYLTNQANVSQK